MFYRNILWYILCISMITLSQYLRYHDKTFQKFFAEVIKDSFRLDHSSKGELNSRKK